MVPMNRRTVLALAAVSPLASHLGLQARQDRKHGANVAIISSWASLAGRGLEA